MVPVIAPAAMVPAAIVAGIVGAIPFMLARIPPAVPTVIVVVVAVVKTDGDIADAEREMAGLRRGGRRREQAGGAERAGGEQDLERVFHGPSFPKQARP